MNLNATVLVASLKTSYLLTFALITFSNQNCTLLGQLCR